MKTAAIELIAAERRRQVEEEGWTPEHDAGHDDGSIAKAAACYAMPADSRRMVTRSSAGLGELPCRGDTTWQEPAGWPWENDWWKPTPDDRVRELVKAGALIAAEIDRLLAKRGAE